MMYEDRWEAIIFIFGISHAKQNVELDFFFLFEFVSLLVISNLRIVWWMSNILNSHEGLFAFFH